MKDRETGNSRGFGFVCYESASSVDMIIAQYDDHRIKNKWVEVKRATPRDQMPPGPLPGSKGKGKGGGDRERERDRGDRGENGRDHSGDRGADAGRIGDTRPGDWQCPNCNVNVFASKTSCFKCGGPKPDSTSAPGGCSPGMPMPMPPVHMPPAGYGYPP